MRLILLGVVCAASVAHADDPRDVFGLSRPQTPSLDCSDGRAFGCVTATDPMSDSDPFALSTWLSSSYLLSLPVADATHDQVASYAMGVGTDGAGVSVAGATGLENRWTIDGAPVEDALTGGVATRVPLVFLEGILVTVGGFSARDRASTGGTIDARLRRGGEHHELLTYAWVSYTAPSKQLPGSPDNYAIETTTVNAGPTATAAIVADGPLGAVLGGRAWYAAGIAPSVSATTFAWTATRLVDNDQNGVPDGLPGFPDTQFIEKKQTTPITYFIPAMARAGVDSGAHHFDLTLLGSVDQSGFYLYQSTEQAAGVDTRTWMGDAIATYDGTWASTHAHVQVAWHHSYAHQFAADAAAEHTPQELSEYVPTTLADDPKLAAACNDSIYPKISECPVLAGLFASGGAGELVDRTIDRPTITADVSHELGHNVVRAGVTGEETELDSDSRFTSGGELLSVVPGEYASRQFLSPTLPCSSQVNEPCPTVTDSLLSYRTRYAAAYVEDTWHPTSSLTLDGGLRWELMWVGTELHFSDELAPRVGATWDPMGNGRSRIWASAGREYALLPAGLGATVIGIDCYADTFVINGQPTQRFVQTGAPVPVAPGISAVAQDEATVGGDVNWGRALRTRLWVVGRHLESGITTNADSLETPGNTNSEPVASRDTILVTGEVQTDPGVQTSLRAGYLYQQTVGSYVGPYDPREGVILYSSTDYQGETTNLFGPLPTSLSHRFYMEAERRGDLGSVKLAASTRLLFASGTPRDVMGLGDDGPVYLIPRGAGGNNPNVAQVNVRVAATWHKFTATLDLLNLFDQRPATQTNPFYSSGSIHAIDGGSYADLVFLRTDDGQPAQRLPTYAVAQAFQPPFSVVLGVHRAL